MTEEQWEQLANNSKYADDTMGRKLEKHIIERACGSGVSKKMKKDGKVMIIYIKHLNIFFKNILMK